MKNQPTPSTWTILAGGVVVLIGSFPNFYEISAGGFTDGRNAWSGDLFFPVTIIPVLCGVLMALHVGLTTFADVKFPDRLVGFGWTQLHLALGFQAAIMMVAFLIQDKQGFDIALGFWLMLLGSIALIVGAVLRTREPAAPAAGGPPSAPPPGPPPSAPPPGSPPPGTPPSTPPPSSPPQPPQS